MKRGVAWASGLAIGLWAWFRFFLHWPGPHADLPLIVVLCLGGTLLLFDLAKRLRQGEWGSDILAGLAIVSSLLLHQYLAGVIIVLMLSGGALLEEFALRQAKNVLAALAKRMPSIAHRFSGSRWQDIEISEVRTADRLQILPHEIVPADGTVVEGHGTMDESYLTGEPFHMSKAPGSIVLSGAINGDTALTIEVTRPPEDSRYAKVLAVIRSAEEKRPKLRRLADRLGFRYTLLSVALAGLAWAISGEPVRFLAVLVVATPCPLILAIPVAILGSISLCARRSIIVKDPAALEAVRECRTAIFDKTGTLTYGEPELTTRETLSGFDADRVLQLAASLQTYSKHPLARAVVTAASRQKIEVLPVEQIREIPGEGLSGRVAGTLVHIGGRKTALAKGWRGAEALPPAKPGMECVVSIDGAAAAVYQFRDRPRGDGKSFMDHLGPRHGLIRKMIVSGDRESEVRWLAEWVGVETVHAGKSPEEKLAIVREETARAKTIFVGDGINDAPALVASTVGIAMGPNSDVTRESAAVVILDSDLAKVDEFFHIAERLRRVALQSAIGGMGMSVAAMGLAAAGLLSPVSGAMLQEVIDVIAIANALRAAWPPGRLTDFLSEER